jgi:hypothetical protein
MIDYAAAAAVATGFFVQTNHLFFAAFSLSSALPTESCRETMTAHDDDDDDDQRG